ncbi:MAG: 4-hydroxy-3-methylbut-2-enyl diphosphate reductase [Lachnospiraceae bacterium]|nr:4-hydroxy-3-methylbut-2-enyl diphosphate reductase [Lachnospiraceae bacterium]
MKVKLARSAGFCFGVKRAVDMVYAETEGDDKVYTYGEIIHNELVVRDLENRGVRILHSPEELAALKEGTVVLRSHGVPRDIYKLLEERPGIKLVDATCPFVLRIHEIVEKESLEGKEIIVIGDASHPEVQGIVSFSSGKVSVIASKDEAEAFETEPEADICVVSQTTFNLNKFKELVEILSEKGYSIHVANTICSATMERQKEARLIASEVDAMIVIGSAESSNTRKLFDICAQICDNTQLIQTLEDLNLETTKSFTCVGITAGASTPNNIIEEVQRHVRGTDI